MALTNVEGFHHRAEAGDAKMPYSLLGETGMKVSDIAFEKDTQTGKSIISQVPAYVAKTCYEYNEIVMPMNFTPKCYEQLKSFRMRPDDVFIYTYPKAGTTWAQQIAFLVQMDGDLSKLEATHIIKAVPFLEVALSFNPAEFATVSSHVEIADAMPHDTPRILKTHAMPKLLPWDLQEDPKAKMIYVARNPKDTAVSFYHFCRFLTTLPDYPSWSEFFEEFIAGRAPLGDWFEHTLFGWNLRHHPNVLFLRFEDMHKNLRDTVEQIADFMGKSLSSDILDRIATASSFNAMKKSKSSNPDIAFDGIAKTAHGKTFLRKGIVGDWINYFTEVQNRRLDEMYHDKITPSGLSFVFE